MDAAKALVGKDVELNDVTPDGLEYVKHIYKAADEGYVVYALVMSRYGTPETETLIHVDNDGKIKNIKKLIWKTSDAMYGYVPPTADTVDAFYNKIIGMDKEDLALIKNADLVSNATNTSTSLRLAIYEGLDAVEQIKLANTPKIIGIILILVIVLSAVAYKVVPMIIKRRKNG